MAPDLLGSDSLLREAYNTELDLAQIRARTDREKWEVERDQKRALLTDQKNHLEKQMQAENQLFSLQRNWRLHEEDIELGDLLSPNAPVTRNFYLSTIETKLYKLKIGHNSFSKNATGKELEVIRKTSSTKSLIGKMTCDKPFQIKNSLQFVKKSNGGEVRFDIYDNRINGADTILEINNPGTHCELQVSDQEKALQTIHMIPESEVYQSFEIPYGMVEACKVSQQGEYPIFQSTGFTSLSCPTKAESIKPLPNRLDGLQERVKLLLGKYLPDDFITNADPYAPLDFSEAPKLKVIMISYLVFRADFSGTVLKRLIEYHAKHGTHVRILVSKVIAQKKDKAQFKKLELENPTVKVDYYKYHDSNGGGALIDPLHRTDHVKIFFAIAQNSNQSGFIIGGRNIHDGFTFEHALDLSKYPELIQYKKDESFIHWRDFDVSVKGELAVQSMLRTFFALWNHDHERKLIRPTSLLIPTTSTLQRDTVEKYTDQKALMIRPYISNPYKDENGITSFYVAMLDSAKHSIKISSPYFRPNNALAQAIHRAVARGVKVQVITRLELKGDTAGGFLGEVNKHGINDFYKKVEIFEFKDPEQILHSKLLLIDDQISFVSGVNLNRRSFMHDLENGMLIHNQEWTKDMLELYEEYKKDSRPLTEKQKTSFWRGIIIKLFDTKF